MFGYGSIPKLTHDAYESIPKSEKKDPNSDPKYFWIKNI